MASMSFLDRKNLTSVFSDSIKVSHKSGSTTGIAKLKGEEFKNKNPKSSRCALKDLRNIDGVTNKNSFSTKKLKAKTEPLISISEGLKGERNAIYEDHLEEWSDIEEMHIHPEPEDDYYDILPKSERLTSDDIEEFFRPKLYFNERSLSPPPLPSPALDVLWPLSPPQVLSPILDSDNFSEKEMELIPFSDDEF